MNAAPYLSDQEAKEAILDIGRRMFARGYVASNDGNISVMVGENAIWTTPNGVSKGFMTEDMLVKVDLNHNVLEGSCRPSSEVKMHTRVYKENPQVRSVSHAHPPVCTAFAVAGISLNQAIMTEAVVSLGAVPVARYATPGTEGVPDSVAPFCKDYNGVLIANHGALAWGKTPYQAYYRLESMEHYATVTMYTMGILGKANLLGAAQVEELLAIRSRIGTTAGGTPVYSAHPTNDVDVVQSGVVDGPYLRPGTMAAPASLSEADMEKLAQRVAQIVLEKMK